MRVGILSGGTGWHLQDLERAARAGGYSNSRLDFRQIDDWVGSVRKTPEVDAIIVRTMPPGSLEQIIFRMDLLAIWQERGIRVINPPRALEICVDKYHCSARLENAGLPVPATYICQTAEQALAVFDKLGGDVVVKPLFGSEGRGLVRVSDPELAWRTCRAIESIHGIIYVQQFIVHPGWDLRVFVLQDQAIAAMKRCAENDWRTNVAQGARTENCRLEDAQAQLAIRSARAVGTFVAGVDLLQDANGNWYVIEVNAVPGWRALAKTTGLDIAGEIIDAIGRNQDR